ncbi:MAG: hypothetical protein ACLFP4_10215 [Spirochaetales bacterium]
MSGLSRQIDLTGGESVYCINTFQMEKAQEVFEGTGPESQILQETIQRLEETLTRNQQAAVAMLLLKRLKAGPVAR